MRTTVSLDSDVAELVRRSMAERHVSFKEVVNSSLRRALAPDRQFSVDLPVFHMGRPREDLTIALKLAADLEDEENLRKLANRT
ncbi:MAG TPA: antitoxin [Chloroflexota bacterium]|nr:antitoxin [Chloroflexota bacterium]